MKLFKKTVFTLTIIFSGLISCQDSSSEDFGFLTEATLSKEEVLSAAESLDFEYPISAVSEISTAVQINDEFDLEEYAISTNKPKINLPVAITIDETTVMITSAKVLKQTISMNKGRKKPQFVFPLSVVLEDGSVQEITDKNGLKDYLDSLDQGVRPVFVYPLSVIKNGNTIVINSVEELKGLLKRYRGKRPLLVFPLSVILEDGSELEIADKDAFEDYLDTLDEGVHPEFVFPISVIKNGNTIVVDNADQLKRLIKKPKKGRKHQFVFPLSVVLENGDVLEIVDKDAFKTYLSSLPSGTKPVFVYPLSIVKKGETIVINNEDELKEAFYH